MKLCCGVWLALMMAACTTAPAQDERPALIVEPTPDSRAELLNTVRTALNNAPLSLAADALTYDSQLLIERQPRFDVRGLPANGRELGLPERFLLSTDGKRCVLTHDNTRQRYVLTQTQCKAREQATNNLKD
jgi:hypothetical protein